VEWNLRLNWRLLKESSTKLLFLFSICNSRANMSEKKFYLGAVCDFLQALIIAFLDVVEIIVAIISFQGGMWKRQSSSVGPTTKYFSLFFSLIFFISPPLDSSNWNFFLPFINEKGWSFSLILSRSLNFNHLENKNPSIVFAKSSNDSMTCIKLLKQTIKINLNLK